MNRTAAIHMNTLAGDSQEKGVLTLYIHESPEGEQPRVSMQMVTKEAVMAALGNLKKEGEYFIGDTKELGGVNGYVQFSTGKMEAWRKLVEAVV